MRLCRLDLFVLDETGTQVCVYLWSRLQKQYTKSAALLTVGADQRIVSVVPSDYNHDGHLDALVMSVSKAKTGGTVKSNIWLGNGATFSRPTGGARPHLCRPVGLVDPGVRRRADDL